MQATGYSRVERYKKKKKSTRFKWMALGLLIVVFVGGSVWLASGADWGLNSGGGAADEASGGNDLHNEGLDSAINDKDSESDGNDKITEEPDPPATETEQPDDGSDANSQEEPTDDLVKLTFVGDVLLGSTVDNLLSSHGYDYPYEHVASILESADILAANLETPITDRGEPEEKQYVYRSKPEVLPAFKQAGFDVVSLANNHILDYWHDGLLDTLDHLEASGIYSVGAGIDEQEAYQPAVLDASGIKVAYLGFSQVVPRNEWKATPYQPGVADTYSLERPIEVIREAKQSADLVVVMVHWGVEREEHPNERQIETARAYIDAGADLVVGSHPHVLQGFEQYKGKWIAYSLGNFIFTTNPDHERTWEGGILNAQCTSGGDCSLELIPVWNKWAQPKPLEGEDRLQVYDRLQSEGIVINENGQVQVVGAE